MDNYKYHKNKVFRLVKRIQRYV